MRHTRAICLGLLMLLLASCGSSSPQSLIIGKWQAEDKEGGMITFKKDGVVTGWRGPLSINGKYRWIDDKTIDLEIDNPLAGREFTFEGKTIKVPDQKTFTLRYTVAITKDEMITTDDKGKVVKFKRSE